MTLHIAEGSAVIRGQRVGTRGAGASYSIPARDILGFDLSRRINRENDVGTLALDNRTGRYANMVSSGDLMRVYADLRAKSGHVFDPNYGQLGYGEGEYGDVGGAFRLCSVMARRQSFIDDVAGCELSVSLVDFVTGILGWREATGSFEERPLSVNERDPGEYRPRDGVLNTLLMDEAPEIGRESLITIDEPVTIEYHETNLLDALVELGQMHETLIWGIDTRLYAIPLDEIILRSRFLGPGYGLSPYGADPGDIIGYRGRYGELYGEDYGSTPLFEGGDKTQYGGERSHTDLTVTAGDTQGAISYDIDDGGLANRVRVNGGTGAALDHQQPWVDSFVEVTEDEPVMALVPVRKAQARKIVIYTRAKPAGQLSVRIQKDDGGQPVNLDSDTSDLSRHTLEHHFLSPDGWTTFIMPNHRYHVPEVWVIVEGRADEEQNHEVAIGYPDAPRDPDALPPLPEHGFEQGEDSTDNPLEYAVSGNGDSVLTHRLYYPFPLAVRVDDGQSQRKHRRRDLTHSNDHWVDRDTVVDEARRRVTQYAWPDETVEFEAASVAAHGLAPGMGFIMDRPRLGLDNEVFVVTDVEQTYANHQRHTTIEGTTLKSYLGREFTF